MFSKLHKRFRDSTGLQLALWYSLIFSVSSLLLFTLAYIMLASAVRDKDREMILGKMNEYTLMGQAGGADAFIGSIRLEKVINQKAGFFVRVADSQNRTLLLTWPDGWDRIDPVQIEDKLTAEDGWLLLQTRNPRKNLMVAGRRFTNGLLLQVGRGTEQMDATLDRFRKIFYAIMIPVVLLGFAGGAVFAHRTLQPIRDLIHTVQRIGAGKMDERVPSRHVDDELDQLVLLFNGMLEKIEVLIRGMRESLDNVAHDLKTPLTRLRVEVETVLQSDADADTLRETLMNCAEESERMVTMLNTLMDISEAESGAMRLNLEDVDIAELLGDVVEMYQYVAAEKDMRITLATTNPLTAQADPVRLRQVVANLLDNAVKYTPDGREVAVEAESDREQVVIRIHDQGPGIPHQDLPRIFDRLYRGDKSRNQRGLGLGLSLVRAVVHAHHGRIEVDSRPEEQGSTFTVFLPLKPPPVAV